MFSRIGELSLFWKWKCSGCTYKRRGPPCLLHALYSRAKLCVRISIVLKWSLHIVGHIRAGHPVSCTPLNKLNAGNGSVLLLHHPQCWVPLETWQLIICRILRSMKCLADSSFFRTRATNVFVISHFVIWIVIRTITDLKTMIQSLEYLYSS